MQNYFTDVNILDFIVSNITAIVMVLTLLSLLLANLSRYAQARRYGIPLKMVAQAGIPDSLEIWIKIICTLGLGVILPLALLTVELHILTMFLVSFTSSFIGITSSYVDARRRGQDKNGVEFDKSVNKYVYPIFSLLTAIAFSYMHFFVNMTGTYIGTDIIFYQEATRGGLQITFMVLVGVWLFIYTVIILGSLIINLMRDMFGIRDILTVELDGQLHHIAMRHTANFWILVPCWIDKQLEVGNISIGEVHRTEINVVKFVKGQFIVRDISSLDGTKNILCRDKHGLVGLKGE